MVNIIANVRNVYKIRRKGRKRFIRIATWNTKSLNENKEEILVVTETARTYYKRYKIVWSRVDEGEWSKKRVQGVRKYMSKDSIQSKGKGEVKGWLGY